MMWVAAFALLCAVGVLVVAIAIRQGGSDQQDDQAVGGGDGTGTPAIKGGNPGGNSSGSAGQNPGGGAAAKPSEDPLAKLNPTERAVVDRTRRLLDARALLPKGTDPLPQLSPPDSITIIVRDLQGYSDDCGCSGPAIGGITRVAALVPEVPLPMRGAALQPRTYLFVGRLLVPELTLPSAREITMAQAQARVDVTAKYLAALPKAVWLPDPGEVAELETEGVDWSALKSFMHPPERELVIEGMPVRFLKPSPDFIDRVPEELAKPTKDNRPRTVLEGPGVPPGWMLSLDLVTAPATGAGAAEVTRVPLPDVGDRARNAVIVARWNVGGDGAAAPVMDATHSDTWTEGGVRPPNTAVSFAGQYRRVRQSPGEVLVNSAVRRQVDNQKRGRPWAAWWSEQIAHGYPEDWYMRHVVDKAEFETGHSGVSLGKELSTIVPDVLVRWQSCQTCHPKAYAAWAASKHSVAYQTLRVAKRHVDARCVGCHAQHIEVVKGGLLNVGPDHRAVTCMTCHTGNEKPKARCASCHNPTTDPKGHWLAEIDHVCPGDTVDPGKPALDAAGSDGTCNRAAKVPDAKSRVPAGHTTSKVPE